MNPKSIRGSTIGRRQSAFPAIQLRQPVALCVLSTVIEEAKEQIWAYIPITVCIDVESRTGLSGIGTMIR